MKINNGQIVTFLNHAPSILQGKVPRKLYTAITLNIDALTAPAKVYTELRDKLDEGSEDFNKELLELLSEEVDVNIQTVDTAYLDTVDENAKFGALTGLQYSVIDFMVTKE